MKQFLIMVALILSATFAQAQTKTITLNGSDAVTDTITNAGTTYLTSPILTAYTSGKFSVALKVTNVSGTSTFKAILQGSLDGTNWTNCHQVAGTNGINCDTLQVTSASPAYWVFRASPAVNSATTSTFTYTNYSRYAYLRIACVGTGTQSTIISGKLLPIQE